MKQSTKSFSGLIKNSCSSLHSGRQFSFAQLGFFFLLLPLFLCISSCSQVITGKGSVVNESRDIKGFDTLISNLPADVYITVGQPFQVTLEGQKNILNLVEDSLEGKKLTFQLKHDYSISLKQPLIIRVKCPDIRELDLNGSGNLYAVNHFQTDSLSIYNRGSGHIKLQGLWVKGISVSLLGSGSISILDGTANKGTVTIVGSGDLLAPSFDCHNMSSRLNGSGEMTIGTISDSLDAIILGSGTLTYCGPAKVSQNVKGSGQLIHIDQKE